MDIARSKMRNNKDNEQITVISIVKHVSKKENLKIRKHIVQETHWRSEKTDSQCMCNGIKRSNNTRITIHKHRRERTRIL